MSEITVKIRYEIDGKLTRPIGDIINLWLCNADGVILSEQWGDDDAWAVEIESWEIEGWEVRGE